VRRAAGAAGPPFVLCWSNRVQTLRFAAPERAFRHGNIAALCLAASELGARTPADSQRRCAVYEAGPWRLPARTAGLHRMPALTYLTLILYKHAMEWRAEPARVVAAPALARTLLPAGLLLARPPQRQTRGAAGGAFRWDLGPRLPGERLKL